MREYRRLAGKHGFNETEREKEYVKMKRCTRNESSADRSVLARVRLMSSSKRERKDGMEV